MLSGLTGHHPPNLPAKPAHRNVSTLSGAIPPDAPALSQQGVSATPHLSADAAVSASSTLHTPGQQGEAGATPGAPTRKRQREDEGSEELDSGADAEDDSDSEADEESEDLDSDDDSDSVIEDRLLACPRCGDPREFCPGPDCIKLWCPGLCMDGGDEDFRWCSEYCGAFACADHADELRDCPECGVCCCEEHSGYCDGCETYFCENCQEGYVHLCEKGGPTCSVGDDFYLDEFGFY